MSDLKELRFDTFQLENDHDDVLATAERPLWSWAVIGALIGLLIGVLATTELTAPQLVADEATPLTLPTDWPDEFAASPSVVFGAQPVRLTVVKDEGGVHSMHVWLTQAAEAFVIDGMPLAASTPIPDAANNHYLISGELGDATALFAGWEQFSTAAGRIPTLISSKASGFVWHDSVEGYFSWTNILDDGTTELASRYITAPPIPTLTIDGEWSLVWTAKQPSNPGTTSVIHVLQGLEELLILDQDGVELGRVGIPANSIIEGVVSGTILGHDLRGIDFAINFEGTPVELPVWRTVPGNLVTTNRDESWIATWDGEQVQIVNVDNTIWRSMDAISRPYWSNTGRYLTITQADQVVIFDITTADFSIIKPEGLLVTAWVKDA